MPMRYGMGWRWRWQRRGTVAATAYCHNEAESLARTSACIPTIVCYVRDMNFSEFCVFRSVFLSPQSSVTCDDIHTHAYRIWGRYQCDISYARFSFSSSRSFLPRLFWVVFRNVRWQLTSEYRTTVDLIVSIGDGTQTCMSINSMRAARLNEWATECTTIKTKSQ